MSELDCDYCDGESTHRHHNVCPRCEQSGFDHLGKTAALGVPMHVLRCWNCGHTHASEVKVDADD